jgi:hypothetical protein
MRGGQRLFALGNELLLTRRELAVQRFQKLEEAGDQVFARVESGGRGVEVKTDGLRGV